ncbi:MAG: hypothetical protein E6Q99_04565 [Elusimicrobia bacterium]|nr:MAG: hypothetical protein E6Q99_04565 [Elusimicrobiota bacterium]
MNRPVTDWENEEVGGKALCADIVFQDGLAKVNALRQQQAAYLAALPTNPEAIISAALAVMHPKGASYPGKFEEAMHMAKALCPMIRALDIDQPSPDRDALLWFAGEVAWALEFLSRDLDHLSEILGNTKRIAREADTVTTELPKVAS